MNIHLLTTVPELAAYERWVTANPNGNLWQSLGWKTYQESLGREVRIYAAMEGAEIRASALVVIDRTTGGFSTWDIPRGPIGNAPDFQLLGNNVVEKIMTDAKKDGCLCLFFSPAIPLATDYQLSPRHEQPDATRIIDLTKSEEEILGQMKPKGRYNIGVAQRGELDVQSSTDIDAFYALLQGTGERDAFGIGPKTRYKQFLTTVPGAFLLLCMHDKKPIAGLMGVTWEKTGIYYYGASSYEHRALMAPYLLQWKAMEKCKEMGCEKYDVLGVAPIPADSFQLIGEEAKSSKLKPISSSHPWAGISGFKEKFGGALLPYPHEQQIVLRPWALRALQLKRKVMG